MTTSVLTPSQQAAVEHIDGPLLVLAGPGSGKTRVITHRIAHLIANGVESRDILAITFTNKAAREMADRVEQLLPDVRIWVSTFHRFCARLLRSRPEAVGLSANFTIFDTADQRQLVKQVLGDLNIDAVHYRPSQIAARISRAKNDLYTAELFARKFQESIGDHTQAVVARVFPEYQRLLLASNAVDFDDLLLHVVDLLNENPELRSEWDQRFRYVLVDEYQDTNPAQYQIVAALSQEVPNLCVTGDPDQSIYGWRGARIDNILRFEKDYPTAKVVWLEQNFRSTPNILRSADRLISHNRLRKHKSLVTDNKEGEPVELLRFRNGRHEADGIAREIRRAIDAGERVPADFAIFYRVNTLSREFELAMRRHRVPFRIAAGVEFYERIEIKDMLGYLRLVANPADRAAFQRVVNRPARKIGKTTLARLITWADDSGVNLLEAAGCAAKVPKLTKQPTRALERFAELIDEFSHSAAGPVEDLLRLVVNRTGYTDQWQESELEEDQQRLANVRELLTEAAQYDREHGDEGSLDGYLESVSLVSDVDNLDPAQGAVTLMTLHAAKGLEFPVVYIAAVEQGLLPHERVTRDELRELEEERRLLFVGMTRACQRLYLTQTVEREHQGRRLTTIPSDFLAETEFELRDLAEEWEDAETPAVPATAKPQAERRKPQAEGRAVLTTAAELLNGTAAPAQIPLGFPVGATVRHPTYGTGTVVTVSGFGRRRSVTVQFDQDDRSQTFVLDKCPLQPVGLG